MKRNSKKTTNTPATYIYEDKIRFCLFSRSREVIFNIRTLLIKILCVHAIVTWCDETHFSVFLSLYRYLDTLFGLSIAVLEHNNHFALQSDPLFYSFDTQQKRVYNFILFQKIQSRNTIKSVSYFREQIKKRLFLYIWAYLRMCGSGWGLAENSMKMLIFRIMYFLLCGQIK